MAKNAYLHGMYFSLDRCHIQCYLLARTYNNINTAGDYWSGYPIGEIMITILYSEGCTPCIQKALWRSLRNKCAEKHSLLERRDITKDQQAKDEANNKYGRAAPFIVLDGKVMSVEEFLNA